MEKLKFETKDITSENIEKIAALFPNCLTETKDESGKAKKAINFELLKQELSHDIIEGNEAYEFTWVGKRAAIAEANRPIRKTLRPCREESVDWDTTENLYIEGDNLEVLKLLQESYLGKVKMIYIDPPYNTGSDFIYRDDFAQTQEEYNEQLGLYDEESGDRLFKNTDSNGRFHSDWCSMIYSRLKLARSLLTDDGVIFISIDDNEVDSLLKISRETFGNNNVEVMIWRKSGVGRDGKMKNTSTVRIDHEYLILCFMGIKILNKSYEKPEFVNEYPNPDNDYRGPYKAGSISRKEEASNPQHRNYYAVVSPSGKKFHRQFDVSKEEFLKLDSDGRIYWGKNGDSVPSIKIFVNEKREVTTSSLVNNKEMTTTEGSKEYEKLSGVDGMGSEMRPKPSVFIKKLVQVATNSESIILDFFSGTATTAHAVMQLNAEDGGKRKFIMVQLPEKTDEKSEAFKAGYANICEIGKERIRRAGAKIKAETGKDDLDIGFRVLKLADSNMTDVYYTPAEYSQDMLASFTSNIKSDRTDMDLLFGCLLDWGLPLTMPHTTEMIEGFTVHSYDGDTLAACFAENIPDTVIKAIAAKKPIRAVFRDAGFADSPAKINVTEIFKLLSPDTTVKVI